MAASDSENFESADEDVPCKMNEANKAAGGSMKRPLINNREISESSNFSAVVENMDNKKSSNTVVSDVTIDKTAKLKASNIGRKNEAKEDKTKRQRETKKLGSNSSSGGGGVKRLGSKLGAKSPPNPVSNSKITPQDVNPKVSNNASDTKELIENNTSIDSSSQKLVGINDKDEPVEKTRDKLLLSSPDVKISPVISSDKNYNLLSKSENESFGSDGWELEDGFEIPSDSVSKPKDDEEFEKELFPVLNKLSTLSTGNNTHLKGSDLKKDAFKSTSSASNWSSWDNWGVSSLLSTATESVTTLTSHMSAGLNTVLESGLGAPDPQVLAQAIEKEKSNSQSECDKGVEEVETVSSGLGMSGLGGGLSQLMSGVSQLSTKVISGGLDTLETLGKKTMEVLQDGDPGLRKKRALFFQDDDRPVLSQVLREAKEHADQRACSGKVEEDRLAARKVHFETLFDDYHGLVHLEALEMLSKQCQLKMHTILLGMSGDALRDLRETIDQVKELCELSDEEDEESDKDDDDKDSDFSNKVTHAINLMGIQVPHNRLIEVSESITEWLCGESAKTATPTASQVHEKAVSSMAEFTSVSMETFHRMAELLLIKQHHSTADEAESLTQLTGTLCARVSRMATKFTLLLSQNDESNSNNGIITTIFMESANSSSYIQDACRLVVPVLQVGAST